MNIYSYIGTKTGRKRSSEDKKWPEAIDFLRFKRREIAQSRPGEFEPCQANHCPTETSNNDPAAVIISFECYEFRPAHKDQNYCFYYHGAGQAGQIGRDGLKRNIKASSRKLAGFRKTGHR